MKVSQRTSYRVKGEKVRKLIYQRSEIKLIAPLIDHSGVNNERWAESDQYEDQSLWTLSDEKKERCLDHTLSYLGDGCFYKQRHDLSDE